MSHEANRFQCMCGKSFRSAQGLSVHVSKFCQAVVSASSETFTHAAAEAAALHEAATSERKASKRARDLMYSDRMRHTVAMDLAQLRFLKLVPAAHVDMMK
eukprot:3472706-Pleurochrysis_carterae.AAC.1